MMLHAAIRWPENADTSLWPMAVDYAVYIHNHLPRRDTGLSPLDLFSGTKWPTHKCNDLHVWGCPVYVLDSQMQDGKKLPRWTTRSRRALFLGLSIKHASTAPLVLNLATQYISAQFHCVFDSWFSTVISSGEKELLPNLDDPVWANLFGNSHFQYHFDDYLPPPLGEEWDEKVESDSQATLIRTAQDHRTPVKPLTTGPPLLYQPSPPKATNLSSSLQEDGARPEAGSERMESLSVDSLREPALREPVESQNSGGPWTQSQTPPEIPEIRSTPQ